MTYEIKTVYQAIVPAFEWSSPMHQGLYWNRETAERMIGADRQPPGARVDEHDVIVMENGDVLQATSLEDPDRGIMKTSVKKATVYGDSDEELRDASLARLPDLWKKVLGLPYDAEKAAQQSFLFSDGVDEKHVRWKLLLLEITDEEARVLGLGDDKRDAIQQWDDVCDRREAENKARRNHPLVGVQFPLRVPSRNGEYETTVTYTVQEKAHHEESGDVRLKCWVEDSGARLFTIRPEDEYKVLRESEIRALLGSEESARV